MPRDLMDPNAWMDRWERKLSRFFSGAFLENASVTNGLLRFIGGLLRLDSGARLEGEGHFAWSGPIYLDGDVQVTKTLDVTAETRLRGETTIEGIARLLSELVIEGKITAGNVRIEDGKIHVGGMVIDPNNAGGSVVFPSGAKITANDGSPGVKIESGVGWVAYVAENGIRFAGGIGQASVTLGPDALSLGGNLVRIAGDQVRLAVPDGDVADVVEWLGRTSGGELRWVSKNQGGPMGSGDFVWPFPLTWVTQEFDPDAEGYQNGHLGIDFGAGAANIPGTDIPAAADGTVLTTDWDDERGWQVILDHGTRDGKRLTTRYYHLRIRSFLADGAVVTRRQKIGEIGNTGMSRGAHLHYETRVDGVAINPRAFHDIYGA